ncbi:MAG: DUF4040 domain-containing protein [Fervidicoccaceae archaeon]|nr:DUF4040 domain-containing protein [Fervidicoccaceae archaeon]
MDITVLFLAIMGTIGLVFAYIAVTERALVKAIIYSAVQSMAFAVMLYLLKAPDIVLVYIPVSVGLYPAALFFLVGKTESEEGEP